MFPSRLQPPFFGRYTAKEKILDIQSNIKDFPSVGVTGFEPATTRPPEEKFIFSDKSN